MARPSFSITNFTEFERDLKRVMENVELGMEKNVLKKAAFDAHRNLQKRTPRKSGRARAGWNTTVDMPPSEWKPPLGWDHYGLTPFRDGAKIKYNSIINLSNNVEYIIPLDEGHSKQADNIVDFVFTRLSQQLAILASKESKRRIK